MIRLCELGAHTGLGWGCCIPKRIPLYILAAGRAYIGRAMAHALNLFWNTVYITGVVIAVVLIARDWLLPRLRRREGQAAPRPANDNSRERRNVRH